MNRNIENSYILANRFDQIMTFRNTIPQLMVNLNYFSLRLEIAEESYTKMYSGGVYFFFVFEKCINNILIYILNDSVMVYIHRKIDSNEEKALSSSIEQSIDALESFYSSVKE